MNNGSGTRSSRLSVPWSGGRTGWRAIGHAWAGGQGLVEYGLMLSLTAVVATAILVVFGSELARALDIIGSAIDSAT